jgi:protein gp37
MSNIQWTDVTDNPIHLTKWNGENGGHWCKKISPGCTNCYAEAKNQSNFFSWASHRFYHGEPPKTLTLNRALIQSWARCRKPKKHFVCSMTDLFGDWVTTEWQFEIFDAMVAAPKQTFQILTKRPQIAFKSIKEYCQINGLVKLPSNIWVGVSVENQRYADERIPIISQVPAHIRFLSVEPLLEQVFLSLENIGWVIVGGESGSYARPCRVEWIQSVVNQCQKLNVPVFVKQLGARSSITLQDSKGGDISEFPKSLQVRNFPKLKVEV